MIDGPSNCDQSTTPVPAASERARLRDGLQTAVMGLRCALAIFDGSNMIGPRINVVRAAFKVAAQAYDHEGTVALSPQPDRAKADEGVDLHKVIATAFYEGCKRIWPKRRLPYKASLLSVAYADEVAPAIIRTLSARAEAAERELATERTLREAAEWSMQNTKGERVIELEQRAEAAEARAETAWAEALEEAARLLEVRGWNGAHNSPVQMIRALRTAPPPTAKGII